MAIHTTPRAPGALPFAGHAPRMLRDPLRFLSSLPAQGDLVDVRLGTMKVTVVCDRELTRQLLLADDTCDKGGPWYDRIRETIGNGLVTCPHNVHRRQRRLIQPSFHPSRLPGYARTMIARATALSDGWHDGQVIDVPPLMLTLSMRALLQNLFSSTLPPQTAEDAIDDLGTILYAIHRRTVLPPALNRLPTVGNRRYHAAGQRLRRNLQTVIAGQRQAGRDHGDLLSAMLSARDTADDGSESTLADAEISDQLITFFAAGSETMANLLSWALHLLSRHPEIEKRLHAEVDSVLAGSPPACLDDLNRLPFLNRVMRETLRLYPPVWMVTREVTAETTLAAHVIPAGSAIMLSPYLLHRQSDVYPDPERFDPGRWDSAHSPQPPRYAFIPFGLGPRKCIGDRYGTALAALALATFSSRWQLSALSDAEVRAVAHTSLAPATLRLRATARPLPRR
ncbi:cytochrome P450 [Streptomyces sp. NPDC058308]|uniref:cytochrome P450 n=1 Tax=Streptomyces sp. NPDC058308 TaxID=3346440 RepID=UPI0036EB3F0A